ncbi:hypothetical protein P3547_19775 [Vibrio parahaemolyticus]|nr:hypothetical protein [Vibrio parahaemolyticus]
MNSNDFEDMVKVLGGIVAESFKCGGDFALLDLMFTKNMTREVSEKIAEVWINNSQLLDDKTTTKIRLIKNKARRIRREWSRNASECLVIVNNIMWLAHLNLRGESVSLADEYCTKLSTRTGGKWWIDRFLAELNDFDEIVLARMLYAYDCCPAGYIGSEQTIDNEQAREIISHYKWCNWTDRGGLPTLSIWRAMELYRAFHSNIPRDSDGEADRLCKTWGEMQVESRRKLLKRIKSKFS